MVTANPLRPALLAAARSPRRNKRSAALHPLDSPGARGDFPSLGTVLQTHFKCTATDCKDLSGPGSRIRLCKGAYKEPPSVAAEGWSCRKFKTKSVMAVGESTWAKCEDRSSQWMSTSGSSVDRCPPTVGGTRGSCCE